MRAITQKYIKIIEIMKSSITCMHCVDKKHFDGINKNILIRLMTNCSFYSCYLSLLGNFFCLWRIQAITQKYIDIIEIMESSITNVHCVDKRHFNGINKNILIHVMPNYSVYFLYQSISKIRVFDISVWRTPEQRGQQRGWKHQKRVTELLMKNILISHRWLNFSALVKYLY